MNPPDNFDHKLAEYLMDGFNMCHHCVTGTTIKKIPIEEGGGYRATIEMFELDTQIECMSREGWFDAAERVVRQALWFLHGRDVSHIGSLPEAS